jgi:hypothetical protein
MRIAKAIALAGLALAAPALAQGWTMIGSAEVGDPSGRTTITLRGDGPFREIMMCVEQAGLDIQRASISYRDGRTQAIRLRGRVGDGDCTRSLALSGRERAISAIDLGFDPASLGSARARVQVVAR